MTKRLTVINKLRPKIVSQGVVDVGKLAKRVAKNTTFNVEEIDAILRLALGEANAALQAGETVKLDGLLSVSPNMKVGGAVNMALRANRGATAGLNNSLLWTAVKVKNHANLSKSGDELVADWNAANPGDPVVD
jgi:hypothetical protein